MHLFSKKRKYTSKVTLVLSFSLVLLFVSFELASKNFYHQEVRNIVSATDLGYSSPTDVLNSLDDPSKLLTTLAFDFNRRPEIPELSITLKPSNYRKFLKQRSNAVALNFVEDAKWISADLITSGKKFEIKLKLKGLLSDHWNSERRSSLKIKVMNGDAINTLREFSLHKPSSRQFPYNHIFHLMLKDIDLINKENRYVKVNLNGTPWGIMQLEEKSGTDFLERNHLKESLLIEFGDQSNSLLERKLSLENLSYPPEYRIGNEKIFFQIKNKLSNVDRRKLAYVIDQWRSSNAVLFDYEKYGLAYFLITLWNDGHPMRMANSEHYFNPYTLKMEPAITDPIGPILIEKEGNFPRKKHGPDKSVFLKTLLNDDGFEPFNSQNQSTIKHALSKADKFVSEALAYFPNDKPNNASNTLRKNFTFLETNDFNVSVDKSSDLENKGYTPLTESQLKLLPDFVKIRHYTDGDIHIFNLLPFDLNITKIGAKNQNALSKPIVLPGYMRGDYSPFVYHSGYLGTLDGDVYVTAEFMGQSKTTQNNLTLNKNDLFNPLLISNAYEFSELNLVNKNEFALPKGSYVFDKPLVVSGSLTIDEGVSINLCSTCSIIVKGGLFVNGSKSAPVKLFSSAGNWQGLYVLGDVTHRSRISNTIIKDVSNIDYGILNLTGGVNFYKADITINNLLIDGSKGEDAINLVKSNFKIDKLHITNSSSDALDSDFSNGLIKNTTIYNSGNDGLDFSGSHVEVNSTSFEKIGDKSISAGEVSELRLHNINIKSSYHGIIAKDGSIVRAYKVTCDDIVGLGIAAYNKKVTYLPPLAELSEINRECASSAKGFGESELRINGEKILNTNEKLNKFSLVEP
ncbi:hypothetical protein ACMAY7_10715 [Rhodobacteraceae bacterium nBUS_24]